MYPTQQHQQGYQTVPDVPPHMMIQGLPNNPPFTPNLNFRPSIQAYATQVTGYALLEIQNKANQNDARKVFYWQCYNNQFQNEYFFNFLLLVADFAELIMATERSTAFQAIPRAVEILAVCLVAEMALNNHSLAAQMDPGYRNQLLGELQRFREIGADIQRFQMQNQQPHMGHQMQGHGFHNAPMGIGGGYTPMQQQRPNLAMGQTTGHSLGAPTLIGTTSTVGSKWSGNKGIVGTPLPPPNPAPVPVTTQPMQTINIPQLQAVEQTTFKVEEYDSGPKHIGFDESGNTILPIKSKPDYYDPEYPIPIAFDINICRTFYVKNKETGKLHERLVKITHKEIQMNASEHETEHLLNPHSKQIPRGRPDVARKEFDRILQANNLEAILRELENNRTVEMDINSAYYAIDNELVENMGTMPRVALRNYLDEVDITIPTDSTINFRVIEVHPLGVIEREQIAFEEMRKHETMIDAHRYFLANRVVFDERLWILIDKLIIGHILELMNIGIGVRGTASSFADDYPDIYNYLLKKKDLNTVNLIDRAVSKILGGIQLFKDTEGTVVDYGVRVEENKPKYGLGVSVNITMLKMMSKDIGLAVRGQYGVVNMTSYPELYKAAKWILDKDAGRSRHLYFNTADDVRLYIYRSLLSEDIIIGLNPFITI